MGKRIITYAMIIVMVLTCGTVSVHAAESGATLNLAFETVASITPIDDYSYELGWTSNTYNNSTNIEILTDGRYGNITNWGDMTTWFKMYRLSGREIVLDLGGIDTINRITMGFGQRNDVGIKAPMYVKYYVSNDGINFTYLGKVLPDVPLYVQSDLSTTPGNGIDRKVYTIDKLSDGTPMNIQGRYVKIIVPVDVNCWADEVEVIGQEGITDGAVIPESIEDPDEALIVNQFPKPGTEESAGLTDQFLFYTGPYTKDPNVTNWTKEKIAKILGYTDKTGETTDWMFHNILVGPVSAFGSTCYTKAAWTTLLDFIFENKAESTQLKAMDEAAGELNAKLGTNIKVSIDFNIPYIKQLAEQSEFGDINGDGINESMNPADFASSVPDPTSVEGKEQMFTMAMENRKAAIHWYIDEVERRFNEAGYKNLELTSFYWNCETVNFIIGEDILMKDTSDYLKSKGYYFTWIPYLAAYSPYLWKDLGVTTASMQPNHSFSAYRKSVVAYNAELAKKTGMSTEIEYGYGMTIPNVVRRFAEYFNAGRDSGYMKKTYHTYYMNTTSLVDAANSTDPVFRAVYDNTYRFIKGTYKRSFVVDLNKPSLADKTNMTVPVSIINADNFKEGEFTVLFDSSKVKYKGFKAGVQLDGKAELSVKENKPGVLKISFKMNKDEEPLFGDVLAKTVNEYTDVVILNFNKVDGVDDNLITQGLFAIDKGGKMKDKYNNIYDNWSAAGNATWSN